MDVRDGNPSILKDGGSDALARLAVAAVSVPGHIGQRNVVVNGEGGQRLLQVAHDVSRPPAR